MSQKIIIRNCAHIKLKQIIDEQDGVLSIAESMREIPFDLKRVFYIYGLAYPKALRGFHAHKKLEQVIFCINGSCKLMVTDGIGKQYFHLSDPNHGIYLGPDLWHTMFEFSNDCIILVLASDYYNESDYIRDYNEFIAHITKTDQTE
jgi:dTDP-4-dehydrorhamnose 3,5-epimerase-like enzyme